MQYKHLLIACLVGYAMAAPVALPAFDTRSMKSEAGGPVVDAGLGDGRYDSRVVKTRTVAVTAAGGPVVDASMGDGNYDSRVVKTRTVAVTAAGGPVVDASMGDGNYDS